MTTVGGPGYRWRGQFTKQIRRGGVDCVTMPRRDSHILVPINLSSNSMYQITLRARNNGGNGFVKIEIVGASAVIDGPVETYVVTPEFAETSINIIAREVYSSGAKIKISRTKKHTKRV